MEAITHFLVSVFIQILCFKYLIFPINLILTMIFAIFSHIILDILSNLTYHTSEVMKGDNFWIIWHVFIIGASILTGLFLIIPFWLGIIFGFLPDIIDWYILRPIQSRRGKNNSEKKYIFHPIIDLLRDKLFFWLPNLRYKKYAIITELIIIGIFVLLIYLYI